jgi:Flp pilus assembly protein TadB
MSGYIVLAAVGTGGAVGNLTWHVLGPRRPPERRMKPYFEVARSRLGGRVDSLPEPVLIGEAARRVLGPLARSVTSRFSRLVRTKSTEDITLQLRQAGANFDLHAYRRSNLFWTSVLPIGLGLVGVFLGSAFLALVLLLVGVPLGSRRMPAHLRLLKRRRAERVRSELPTIAVMLATKVANTKSLLVALSEITEIGTGPVVDDIKRALRLVESGYAARAAFELASVEAVEPAAARAYRLIGQATTGGIDLASALIDLAGEVRAQRREEVERTAAKRQLAMTGPIVAFTVPVIALFLIAPTTSVLSG